MFKKKLAIFALALALSTGTAVSAFADTTNKVAIENCGAYLFEWRPVDCGDGVAFAILVGGNTIQESDVILNRGYDYAYTFEPLSYSRPWGTAPDLVNVDGKWGIPENWSSMPEGAQPTLQIVLKTNYKTLNTDKRYVNVVHLPSNVNFDYLPAKSNYKDPASFYGLSFRIARFQISEDTYETVLTNLDKEQYPLEKLKQLYALRWGIETSFRDLKYTIGMLDFHSKKVMCIQQEIYAHLIMYNFAEMITSHVVIEKKQRKYTYKANFSVASHLCRLFYRGKTTSPDLETIIAKNVIPIRPDRHGERKATTKIFHGFLYRVA